MSDAPHAETSVSVPPPDPREIQRLFDEDPLKLSDRDIDEVVRYFQLERNVFLTLPKEKKSAAAKPKSETAKAAAQLGLDIGLGDLGL